MEKTRINLDLLLPELPDERDACVDRIMQRLSSKKGIDRVHLVPSSGNNKTALCFHYDPSLTTVNEVEQLARQAGAALTEQWGHLIINTKGIRQQRHARLIESGLRKQRGLQDVSISGNGFIRIEFDKKITGQKELLLAINKAGLEVISVDDFHAHPKESQGSRVHSKEHIHDHAGETPVQADHPHDHGGEDHDHQQVHGGIFGEKTELIFALICGGFLAAGFALSFFESLPKWASIGCYAVAYIAGGWYTTKEAIQGISKGIFEIDFLMLVAAAGAAVLGNWAEGALLLFLFSLGHALEHYALDKAKKSIAALSALTPKTALLKNNGSITEVSIDALKLGDVILVKPNSKISADGFVVQGQSSVNQAPITGESMPVDKQAVPNAALTVEESNKLDASHKVFAGTINGSGNLEIKVTRIAADSSIARLVKLVNEAQTQKSPTQNFTDKIERYYVPAVLILVGLLLLAFLVLDEPFSASFYRAMSVLVAASPCALAISTPSAVLSGVARAARGGVLIKGGKPLEELGSLSAIAFDKTGTLTQGKPKLTGVFSLNGVAEDELLRTVIAVEQLSDHPLAAAVVKGAREKLGKEVSPASDVQAITGRGVKANYEGRTIHLGNKELFTEKNDQLSEDIQSRMTELENKGNTSMLVQQDDHFIGIISLMDIAREESVATLASLKKLGIRKMIMLTGDNQRVADAIARDIGITEARGNLLPEQKVAAIEELKASEKKVAMVGDGVNDAPAMAKSTVGIAMGAAGSDVALETADIALMADRLENLPFAIGLSKKAHAIIRQNLVISLGMVALLVPLTILGIAHMGPAVIGHEGSTLVVVLNALRLLAYKQQPV